MESLLIGLALQSPSFPLTREGEGSEGLFHLGYLKAKGTIFFTLSAVKVAFPFLTSTATVILDDVMFLVFLPQPPFSAFVMLYISITPLLSHSGKPEIEFLDILVILQFFCWSIQYDPAVFHHITILG
jgi:hypothetical protein